MRVKGTILQVPFIFFYYLLEIFFAKYKKGVSHKAIKVSMIQVDVAIINNSEIEYIFQKAKNVKKKFSKQLQKIVEMLFLNHIFFPLNFL